jgi:predicted phage tail component-like protein
MPELGLTYRGIHCSIYGVRISKVSRPLFAQVREITEEIAGRDGSYDFSAANSSMRPTYQDKIIEAEANLVEASGNLQTFRQRLRPVSAWIAPDKGKGELIFDDEPDIIYLGKLNNLVSLDQFGAVGSFPLTFRCDPFAYSAEVTTSKECAVGDNVLAVNNLGNFETPMVIEIKCRTVAGQSTVNPLLTLGALSIKWIGTLLQDEILTIDTEKIIAVKGATNAMSGIVGSWLKLAPGNNSLAYSDEGVNKSLVTVKHKARWY